MKIEIEPKSGFCFGVENAIKIAEESLISGESVYCLGHIVHNEFEVERLKQIGLITIDHDQFRKLLDCKVLIRAHGEPPSTYKIAEENNIDIIDATCPIVKRLQSKIQSTWCNAQETGEQIVLFGQKGHAEVVGLLGHTGGNTILVNEPKDLKGIDFRKPLAIFAQTTKSKDKYFEIIDLIKSYYREMGSDPEEMIRIRNSICGQVSNREPALIKFALKHDVIIFVSGKVSSNGRMLYQVCKSVNKDTYFISSVDEINPDWFKERESIGICGATSTPKWLINDVYKRLEG
jgi:4-hydroxy-3-methylbut-2-enyl diphosphate reductase